MCKYFILNIHKYLKSIMCVFVYKIFQNLFMHLTFEYFPITNGNSKEQTPQNLTPIDKGQVLVYLSVVYINDVCLLQPEEGF